MATAGPLTKALKSLIAQLRKLDKCTVCRPGLGGLPNAVNVNVNVKSQSCLF